MRGKNNAVIIPTYNEKDNVRLLIGKIFELLPETTILIVDDNSPDKTGDEVKLLMASYPNLHLLERDKKEGLGKAYVAGFKNIIATAAFQMITMMDGDLSHNPKYLPKMLELAAEYDLVIGSRYIKDGGVTSKWERWRKFLSRGANIYLRLIFRLPIQDWTTGYNVIRIDALQKINLDILDPKGYAFISSLKYYLLKAGATAKEYPIIFEERNKGESKMSLSIILEAIFAPWSVLLKK